MSNALMLLNRYTPKVGMGVDLVEALRNQDRVWRDQGLPGFGLWKPYDGPHNGIVSVQRWESFARWEEVRSTLPGIPECRSAVFDVLYPTNQVAYETTYYEEIQ